MRQLFVIFTLVLSGCGSPTGVKPIAPTTEKQDRQLKAKLDDEVAVRAWKAKAMTDLAAMGKKHNAVADWNKQLRTSAGKDRSIYTIEIQDSLISASSRPILFVGHVADVLRKGDICFLHATHLPFFEDNEEEIGMPQINFILECPRELATRIIQESRNTTEPYASMRFAIVGLITHVDKRESGVEVHVDARFNGGDGTANAQASGMETVIATGRCLDAIFLGVEP